MTESYYSTVCKFMLDNDERHKSMFATNVALLELNSVFSLTATFQNVPVVYAILRTPTLHNPPNIPLCSLAFSDLFVGCVVRKIYRYFINGTTQSCSRFGCQNKYQYHLTKISHQNFRTNDKRSSSTLCKFHKGRKGLLPSPSMSW